MTPAARQQAAIEILDLILAGEAAEKALTTWARRNRFAGSKDRAAVRDHVFTAIRCLRSHSVLGGARSGRGLILGALRAAGTDPATVFSGQGYAPAPLSEAEQQAPADFTSEAERLDIPDWLWPAFAQSLGENTEAAAEALQSRAPVHLRANLSRGTVKAAVSALAEEGIKTVPYAASQTALEVTEGQRRIKNSRAYTQGLVELQDAASQAVVDALPLKDGMRVLDYCAGGGGKSLAMAARAKVKLIAHDANPARMKDLPDRAKRAGVKITTSSTQDLTTVPPFDLVLCDVPCSGSGSWRRAPEGKWQLTSQRLDEICQLQYDILCDCAEKVSANGVLAYATCSMLQQENYDQVQRFISQNEGWNLIVKKSWQVQNGTDGFFVAVLTRNPEAC